MSYLNDIPTFKATSTLQAKRMVKINTSATDVAPAKVKVCGATGIPHGISEYAAATNDFLAVKPFPFFPGKFEVEVTISTAINVGTTLYCAAAGVLSDHQATNAYAVAIAVQQAAASGDHIQVMPLVNAMFSNS